MAKKLNNVPNLVFDCYEFSTAYESRDVSSLCECYLSLFLELTNRLRRRRARIIAQMTRLAKFSLHFEFGPSSTYSTSRFPNDTVSLQRANCLVKLKTSYSFFVFTDICNAPHPQVLRWHAYICLHTDGCINWSRNDENRLNCDGNQSNNWKLLCSVCPCFATLRIMRNIFLAYFQISFCFAHAGVTIHRLFAHVPRLGRLKMGPIQYVNSLNRRWQR